MAYKECFLPLSFPWKRKKITEEKRKKEKNKTKHDNREKTCDLKGSWVEEGCTEFGISRCKLLYIRWINNKVLLYSMRTIFNTL